MKNLEVSFYTNRNYIDALVECLDMSAPPRIGETIVIEDIEYCVLVVKYIICNHLKLNDSCYPYYVDVLLRKFE